MAECERQPEGERPFSQAYVLRFVWDGAARAWRIGLKSSDGRITRTFATPEALFRYLAAQLDGKR